MGEEGREDGEGKGRNLSGVAVGKNGSLHGDPLWEEDRWGESGGGKETSGTGGRPNSDLCTFLRMRMS